MNKVTAIIIDDEKHNRNVLQMLLKKHCPLVDVIDEALDADEAYLKINAIKPQLVFLDIKMPKKSWFDLLKMFDTINFEVIFVSAFDEYAITAFEFSALGYILKPINYEKLQITVGKAIDKIFSNHSNNNILHFIKTLGDKKDLINKISIHHNEKVIFIDIEEIVLVESKMGACEIKLIDHTCYYSSKTLKLFEEMLEKAGNFIRINKTTVINANQIKSYTKGDFCSILMLNDVELEVSRRKKAEVLSKIKPS
jgi:two-component system LytT family response regulator